MNEVIAFCSQLPQHEENFWLAEISVLASNLDIIPFSQLSPQQKSCVKVAIVANPNPQELAELKNLQWIQSLWAGVERLLTELPNDKIQIVRMIDPKLSSIMAEAVLTWTLYLHRDMHTYHQQQKYHQWQQHPIVDASDRQVSILGLGELGKTAVTKLLANDFAVSGWSRSAAKIAGVNCFHGEDGLVNMLKNTDILICLLPLTPTTAGLLNKNILSLLPSSASIINFSRGPIIIDDDLLHCLNNNKLQHAVLDVFHQEPLEQNHPFWSCENITILPHISAPTSRTTASTLVAKNLSAFFNSGIIPTTVDRTKGY